MVCQVILIATGSHLAPPQVLGRGVGAEFMEIPPSTLLDGTLRQILHVSKTSCVLNVAVSISNKKQNVCEKLILTSICLCKFVEFLT